MKGTLTRFFSAVIIVVLVISVIYTDLYAQRLALEDAKEKSTRQQEEKLEAIEADKQKEIQEEQERLLLREHEEQQMEMATYLLAAVGGQKNLFTNKVDGYTIEVPDDMKADMSYSNIRAVLEDQDLKIEIYRQDVGKETGGGIESYINYSNQFINNNVDHFKELQGNVTIGGRRISYLQWSRSPLARVENDRCHYASVEVRLSRSEVLSFFFKSSKKI